MHGSFFRFYVHENHRHRGRLVWEWLMEEANKQGIRGGSAFRAVGGFGRHHVLHETTLLDLPGSETVEVEFILSEQESRKLLSFLRQHKVRLFYAQIPALFGVTSPDRDDPADENT